jgi:GNAT superfamily N-acetyltransferase
MTLKILQADYADPLHAADILILMDEYAGDPMGGGQSLPAHVRDRLVRELARRPYAFSVLAYEGAEAVGLINCFESFSTFAARPLVNIHDIVVASHWRGQGICEKMLEKVEALAREKDCCKLTLEVLEGNKGARSAYTRFGFHPYTLDEKMGQALFWQKKL